MTTQASVINRVSWDYSERAATYEDRADYHDAAIARLLRQLPLPHLAQAVDIGAGTGKLTRPLLAAGLKVVAVEPNENMRAVAARMRLNDAALWVCGRAEQLPLPSARFDLACFGSSFNVVDAELSLDEVTRVLKDDGVLTILWNHRDLNDPLQAAVESSIQAQIPNYTYGLRRQDPSATVLARAQFVAIDSFRSSFDFTTTGDRYIAAWRSHATLARAAESQFELAMDSIAKIVPHGKISVPYSTAVWVFRKRRA